MICPLVGIGLTETLNSGWAKAHSSHPLAALLVYICMSVLDKSDSTFWQDFLYYLNNLFLVSNSRAFPWRRNWIHRQPRWLNLKMLRDEFELEFFGSSEPELWKFQAKLGHFNFRAETELTILTICMSKNSKFLTYLPILLLYHDSNQLHAHLLEFM